MKTLLLGVSVQSANRIWDTEFVLNWVKTYFMFVNIVKKSYTFRFSKKTKSCIVFTCNFSIAGSESESSDIDYEEELETLLRQPLNKKRMRMYADDIEDETSTLRYMFWEGNRWPASLGLHFRPSLHEGASGHVDSSHWH